MPRLPFPKRPADDPGVLPAALVPVPDKLTIWPMEDGTYGIDATFTGKSGAERARYHETDLKGRGVKYKRRKEADGGRTLRLGPVTAEHVHGAVDAFVPLVDDPPGVG